MFTNALKLYGNKMFRVTATCILLSYHIGQMIKSNQNACYIEQNNANQVAVTIVAAIFRQLIPDGIHLISLMMFECRESQTYLYKNYNER